MASAPSPAAPQVAVGAVVVVEGRLLTVRRGQPPAAGAWSLPGGRVEAGERVTEAVRREVAEETGLAVRVGALLGFTEHLDDHHHYVILDFLAHPRACSEVVAGDDAADVAWLSRSGLARVETTDGLVGLLEEWHVDLAP